MKKALFPGSFDPITVGHEDIVRKASKLFDEVVVGIGENSNKKYLFPLEQRTNWIQETFKDLPNVSVAHYSGLTVDFCHSIGAQYIVRGLRNALDFEYESNIARLNATLKSDIETIVLISKPELVAINSTIVREIIKHKGNVSTLVPSCVAKQLY
jgi:pantetheine-phosphate adenylyltransferase